MGRGAQVTTIRLKFVNEYRDRHGKTRRYFRRPGSKQTPLPGLPGSSEFMAAYQAALAGIPPGNIGASRTKPGTINAAIVSYYTSSVAFGLMAPGTQRLRRNVIERFRAEHGDKPVALLTREHVEMMVAAKAKTPAAARTFLKAL